MNRKPKSAEPGLGQSSHSRSRPIGDARSGALRATMRRGHAHRRVDTGVQDAALPIDGGTRKLAC